MAKRYLVYTTIGTFTGLVETTSPLTIKEPLLLRPGPKGQIDVVPVPADRLVLPQAIAYGPVTETFEQEITRARSEMVGIKVASPQDLPKASKVLQFEQQLKEKWCSLESVISAEKRQPF